MKQRYLRTEHKVRMQDEIKNISEQKTKLSQKRTQSYCRTEHKVRTQDEIKISRNRKQSYLSTIVCFRSEDGLRCRQGVKPPLKLKLSQNGTQSYLRTGYKDISEQNTKIFRTDYVMQDRNSA